MNDNLNYDYVLGKLGAMAAGSNPAILDFGCGKGQVVADGVKRGLDIFGADTYEGYFEGWTDEIDQDIRPRLYKIENGRIPCDDGRFDIVITNQVFEHIKDYVPSLKELHRILKPGGKMVALFPVQETIYDAHLKMYFPQYLGRWPRVQYHYIKTLRTLGFGLDIGQPDVEKWTVHVQQVLNDHCFYHPTGEFLGNVEKVFGDKPERSGDDYIRWRIRKSAKLAGVSKLVEGSWANSLLESACVLRGGIVFSVTKKI